MQWEHKGYEIKLDENGWFTAAVDTVEINAPTLKEVREKIDKELTVSVKKTTLALKVVGVIRKGRSWADKPPYDPDKIWKGTLKGVNRTTHKPQFDEIPSGWSTLYYAPDTPSNTALMEESLKVDAEAERVEKRRDEVALKEAHGYGRIDANRYNSLIEAIKKEYKEKSRA